MAKKAKPRRDRNDVEVFSTHFPNGFKDTEHKCFVPYSQYRKLEKKYHALFKRMKRESDRQN